MIVSIKADIDIVPNAKRSADIQFDFRVLTQGTVVGAGRSKKDDTSGKDYVSLLSATHFRLQESLCQSGQGR